ncbi:hypothetical protein EON66_11925 [archaeon]|nr:MAG: hypothetical protein EON66_11925 [archaeon]
MQGRFDEEQHRERMRLKEQESRRVARRRSFEQLEAAMSSAWKATQKLSVAEQHKYVRRRPVLVHLCMRSRAGMFMRVRASHALVVCLPFPFYCRDAYKAVNSGAGEEGAGAPSPVPSTLLSVLNRPSSTMTSGAGASFPPSPSGARETGFATTSSQSKRGPVP